uniref:Putative transmembrane protein n=1 Tax=Toxoplasma gondii COUG TaxID=1074873 RepID=A0A2G8Y0A6_TOXGO|nr:putative transmembrane protein [Toxoplasma gondii COUG]
MIFKRSQSAALTHFTYSEPSSHLFESEAHTDPKMRCSPAATGVLPLPACIALQVTESSTRILPLCGPFNSFLTLLFFLLSFALVLVPFGPSFLLCSPLGGVRAALAAAPSVDALDACSSCPSTFLHAFTTECTAERTKRTVPGSWMTTATLLLRSCTGTPMDGRRLKEVKNRETSGSVSAGARACSYGIVPVPQRGRGQCRKTPYGWRQLPRKDPTGTTVDQAGPSYGGEETVRGFGSLWLQFSAANAKNNRETGTSCTCGSDHISGFIMPLALSLCSAPSSALVSSHSCTSSAGYLAKKASTELLPKASRLGVYRPSSGFLSCSRTCLSVLRDSFHSTFPSAAQASALRALRALPHSGECPEVCGVHYLPSFSPTHLHFLSRNRPAESPGYTAGADASTRLLAHRKQNKGAKKWTRNRPKKTVPSQINTRPSVFPPNVLNYINAPPEYLPAPGPEAAAVLNRPKIARLLHLLWLLPRQCQRGSAAFIPGPVPCPLPAPKVVFDSLEPPGPEQLRAEKEYAEFVAHQDCEVKNRAAACAAQFDRPLVNAAAAGVDTEAGQAVQALAYDEELQKDLRMLKQVADEQDDEALKVLHEHLCLAISPARLPGTAVAPHAPSGVSEQGQGFTTEKALGDGAAGRERAVRSDPLDKTADQVDAKSKKKPVWLPLHLQRAKSRHESAATLVRDVCRSPLTRFNRLLIAEAIDRWWSAWQSRRFAGLVTKKLGRLKCLGRQFKAGGVPPEKLLEENAFEEYRLFDDLPRTRFVANYMRRHSCPWQPLMLSSRSEASSHNEGAATDGQHGIGQHRSVERPLERADWRTSDGRVMSDSDRNRRRALKLMALQELKAIGILESDGSVDLTLLKELYRTQPAIPPRDEKTEGRRRSLPADKMSRHERHQQVKYRQAAVGLTLPATTRDVKALEEWERRENCTDIGGKIARATGVFDALLREDFPQYEPLRDVFKLEEFVEAEYRQHTMKRELRKLYLEWLQRGMPDDPKKRSKNDFLVYWMRLSKRKRKALLYAEQQLAPVGASNAYLMRRIRAKTLVEKTTGSNDSETSSTIAQAL